MLESYIRSAKEKKIGMVESNGSMMAQAYVERFALEKEASTY
jgi:hypothetical protein